MLPVTCFVISELTPVNSTLKLGKRLNSASAVLLAALILFLSVAGASPALHKLIHADASAVNHNCAVTLFAKGQISSDAPAQIYAFFDPRPTVRNPVESTVGNSVIDIRLTPSRAPPSC